MTAPLRTLVIKVKFRYRPFKRGYAGAQSDAWHKIEYQIRKQLRRPDVCIDLEEITSERWDALDSPLIEGEVYCHAHGCVHTESDDPYGYGSPLPPGQEPECGPKDWRQIAWVPIEGDDQIEVK